MRRLDTIPPLRRNAVDADTLAAAARIVADVRARGEAAVREHARRLGDKDGTLVFDRTQLRSAWDSLPANDRALLLRTADRIGSFAAAQREALLDGEVDVDGGRAGWRFAPVERAGCYAPGGRYPLPSSVLMTVVTACVAGVAEVWLASPSPSAMILAAAHVGGAHAVLAAGGAQAIAALAYGAGAVPRCDVIVGPGNRWVTAAKQLVAGHVAIDMLAGPSELVVLADESADADLVAADLLAQAEHDPDALPVLLTTSAVLADRVDAALERQLGDLPTAAVARAALAGGFTVVVDSVAVGVSICDALAPEHLALHVRHLEVQPRHYGAVFLGAGSAESFGDYGTGPNHVLPTGGTARSSGGLSVATFLRMQTWLRLDDPSALAADVARFARMEGLEAHARAAERRLGRVSYGT